MHLDGWTLLLQLVNFLILVAILRWALYRPLRRLAEERQARLQSAHEAARVALEAADAARREHESALAELQQQCKARMDEAERAADRVREDARERAHAQTAELIAIARRALTEERAAALDWLQTESGRIGARFATRVLQAYGPTAGPELSRTLAVRVLAELPERDLEALAHAGERLTITTAETCDAAEQARWQATLLPWTGPSLTPEFRCDPALLGGALLEWPGSRLDLSWAHALHQARAEWTAAEAADALADR